MKTTAVLSTLGVYAVLATLLLVLNSGGRIVSWSAQNPTIPSSQCAEKSEYRLRVVERKCISFTVYQAAEDPPSPVYTDGFLLNVDLAVYSTPIRR